MSETTEERPRPTRPPMRRGPMGGASMPAEKAMNFGASAKRLAGRLKPHWVGVLSVFLFTVVSVTFSVIGPKLLGQATTLIFEGVISKGLPAGVTKAQIIAGLRAKGDTGQADLLSGMHLTPGIGVDLRALSTVLMWVLALYVLSSVFGWLQAYVLNEVVQRILVPFLAGHFGDDLLGEYVERLLRYHQRIEFAAAYAVEQGGAFDEVVARGREQARFGRAAHGMACASGALQEGGDGAWRGDLADQVDVADVDTEFERGGGDQRTQLALFQALLRIQSLLARQAAVMRGDRVLAEAFAQMPRQPLGQSSRIHEDQGRAMRGDQCRKAIVVLVPHLV